MSAGFMEVGLSQDEKTNLSSESTQCCVQGWLPVLRHWMKGKHGCPQACCCQPTHTASLVSST